MKILILILILILCNYCLAQDLFQEESISQFSNKRGADYVIDKNSGYLNLGIAEELKFSKYTQKYAIEEKSIFRLIIYNYKLMTHFILELKENEKEESFILSYVACNRVEKGLVVEIKGNSVISESAVKKIKNILYGDELLELSRMSNQERSLHAVIMAETQQYSLEFYKSNKYHKIDVVKVVNSDYSILEKYEKLLPNFIFFKNYLFSKLLMKTPESSFYRVEAKHSK